MILEFCFLLQVLLIYSFVAGAAFVISTRQPARPTTSPSIPCVSMQLSPAAAAQRATTKRHAFSLTSALESVAEQNEKACELLTWMDPLEGKNICGGGGKDEATSNVNNNNTESGIILPLYPLQATYLPAAGVNYTLRNVESRNLQMALDLGVGGRFCVVLMAVDTGRLATVGTILQIISMEHQYADTSKKKLARIILTCQAEPNGIVDICQIINPQAATWEKRLQRSNEYLKARVVIRRRPTNDEITSVINDNRTISSLLQDYRSVRDLYMQGVGTRDLPPFAREKLVDSEETSSSSSSSSLPLLTPQDIAQYDRFWKTALHWQTLCYTIREGHQILLAADRNEQMVAAVLAQNNGPLQLPIHLEDLEPSNRRVIQELECQAQTNWLKLQLDPCIDFQVLLALPTVRERVEHLADLFRREHIRLKLLKQMERKEDLIKTQEEGEKTERELVEPPRKGAWFNDDYW